MKIDIHNHILPESWPNLKKVLLQILSSLSVSRCWYVPIGHVRAVYRLPYFFMLHHKTVPGTVVIF